MKNILFTILAVVVMFSFAVPAMAKGAKAPKELCVMADPGGSTFIMGIKKGAKIMYGDTKIDMYTVQGALVSILPIPASGSGYMLEDTFVFQVSSSISTNISALGAWNVVTELGSVTMNVTGPGGFTSMVYDLVPCTLF